MTKMEKEMVANPAKAFNFYMRCLMALIAVYVLLIFILPVNKMATHAYNLSATEYHILLFMTVLPSLVVWYAAFYGTAKLQDYARSIAQAPESIEFSTLAKGLGWLAWSLPVPAIASLLLNSIAYAHHGFAGAAVIITNYVGVLLPVIGFNIIATAAKGITSKSHTRTTLANARLVVLALIVVGVAYTYVSLRNFNLDNLSTTHNIFHLPIWLMMATVIIPYLYAWFIGLLSAYEISFYGQHVKGVLYRQPLQLLALGLGILIIGFIALQYTLSGAPPISHLVLNYRLLDSYLFRIVVGVGFLFIAYGVNRLKKIEDV